MKVIKKNSRRLVIDTSVIQSAGESEKPLSSACRNFLIGVLEICHRIVMTNDINKEWEKHKHCFSRFAIKWKASMVRKGKVVYIDTPAKIKLDLSGISEKEHDRIQKDIFLLNAALATDRIIVTRDERLQTDLRKTSEGEILADKYRWLNPITDRCESV